MENKTLYAALIALPVAVGAPMGGAAFATVSNTTTTTNTNNENMLLNVGTSNNTATTGDGQDASVSMGGSGPLNRNTDVQLSSGTIMAMGLSDDAGNRPTGAHIAVGTTHTGGNSTYGGVTTGGSVVECADNNCPANMHNDASNMATSAGTAPNSPTF